MGGPPFRVNVYDRRMAPKSVLSIRLTDDDIETLTQAARYRGMTASQWLRLMVTKQNDADRKSGKLKRLIRSGD